MMYVYLTARTAQDFVTMAGNVLMIMSYSHYEIVIGVTQFIKLVSQGRKFCPTPIQKNLEHINPVLLQT